MQTILDFTKEIVNEILQYKNKTITIKFTPDAIQIVNHYDNWPIIKSITFLNCLFNVSIDYKNNIVEEQFKTIKEAVNFIFE